MLGANSSCRRASVSVLRVAAVALMAVFSTFLSIADAKVRVSEPENVIGGVADSIEKWPWMVSLVETDNPNPLDGYICGASLIAPDRVLTAGHCVERRSPLKIQALVGGGKLSDSNGGQRIDVVGISVHPKFPKPGWYPYQRPRYDAALLKLSRSVQVPPIKPADPGQTYLLRRGTPVTVLGHGTFEPGGFGIISDPLREGYLNTISDSECAAAHVRRFLAESMVCAQDRSEPKTTSACYGDSGGPLVARDRRKNLEYYQVGVVSWAGIYCQPNVPSVFARLPAINDFITTADPNLVFKPYNTSNPQHIGSPKVGTELRCSPGVWGGHPARFGYQWSFIDANGERLDIPGAKFETYTLKSEDAGKYIFCAVTAQNAGGYGQAFSEKALVEM